MLDYKLLENTCDNLITLKAFMRMSVIEGYDIYVDEEKVLAPVDDAIEVINELAKETGLEIYRFFGGALQDFRKSLYEAMVHSETGSIFVSSVEVDLLDTVYEYLEKIANKEREKRGMLKK